MNTGMVARLVAGGLGLLILSYDFLIKDWNEATSGISGFYRVFRSFPLLGVIYLTQQKASPTTPARDRLATLEFDGHIGALTRGMTVDYGSGNTKRIISVAGSRRLHSSSLKTQRPKSKRRTKR